MNDLDLPESFFCKDLIRNAATFDEKMYSWTDAKIEQYMRTCSENNFIYIEFTWRNLGRDDAWYEDQCRELNNDRYKIKRELDLEWAYAGDTSPFLEEDLEGVMAGKVDPIGSFILPGLHRFETYKEDLDPNRRWIISVDVASGLSKDDTAVTISDPDDLRPVATFRSNKIDTAQLRRMLQSLVRRMFQNAVLVIESNNHGRGVLDELMKTDVEKNLYWEYRERMAEKRLKNGMVVKTSTKVKMYGVETTVSTRAQMIEDLLFTLIREDPGCFRVGHIIDDIRRLERKKNGKIEHRAGEKDDGLFSYLIGRWVVAFGKNAKKFDLGLPQRGVPYKDFRKGVADSIHRMSFNNRRPSGSLTMTESFIQEHEEAKTRMYEEATDRMTELHGVTSSTLFSKIMQMNRD
jgi:hypothetical protein